MNGIELGLLMAIYYKKFSIFIHLNLTRDGEGVRNVEKLKKKTHTQQSSTNHEQQNVLFLQNVNTWIKNAIE